MHSMHPNKSIKSVIKNFEVFIVFYLMRSYIEITAVKSLSFIKEWIYGGPISIGMPGWKHDAHAQYSFQMFLNSLISVDNNMHDSISIPREQC